MMKWKKKTISKEKVIDKNILILLVLFMLGILAGGCRHSLALQDGSGNKKDGLTQENGESDKDTIVVGFS